MVFGSASCMCHSGVSLRLMWWFMSQFNSQTMPLCFCFMCGLLKGKSKTCITSYTELGDPFLQCSPLQDFPPHFIALKGPFFYFFWSECWVSLRVVVPLRFSCSSILLGLPSRQESEKKIVSLRIFPIHSHYVPLQHALPLGQNLL